MTEHSPTLSRALSLLESGDPVAAEKVVADAVQQAEERHGPQSVERAAALFELANLLLAVRDLGRARDVLRQCCAIPAGDQQSTRSRLTYRSCPVS